MLQHAGQMCRRSAGHQPQLLLPLRPAQAACNRPGRLPCCILLQALPPQEPAAGFPHAQIGLACPCPPDRVVIRVEQPQLAVLGSVLQVLRAQVLTVSDDHGAQALQQAAVLRLMLGGVKQAPGSKADADGAALLQHAGPEAVLRRGFQIAHASFNLKIEMIVPEEWTRTSCKSPIHLPP